MIRHITKPSRGPGLLWTSMALLAGSSLVACSSAPREVRALRLLPAEARASTEASPRAMRAHMAFLASDLLQGREPGTPGYDIAAAYVASQFALLGAKPAGGGGSYMQPVPLVRFGATGNPRLSVRRPGGKPVELVEGEDFSFLGWPRQPHLSMSAPLAFAGYGLVVPELGRDDFAGLNVSGKVVVVLDGAPAGFPGSASRYANPGAKRAEAGKRGAVGVIFVTSFKQDSPARVPSAAAPANLGRGVAATAPQRRSAISLRGPEGEFKSAPGTVPNLGRVDRSGAAKLLSGAPVSLEQIQAAASAPGGKMPAFALPSTLQADLRTRVVEILSANVAGMIEGSDPVLRDEVIVLGAHLDHLGMIPAVAGDMIANGALDNASGVASLLEVARLFRDARSRPRRSILLLAVTAEEQGLLGSEYFVNHPTVPKATLAANINLDMPILTYAFEDVVVIGAELSTIGPAAQRAAARIGIRVTPATRASQSLFGRSDQLNFAKAGVPAIFLRTGGGNGGAAASDTFDQTCYHRACDDLSQPIDYQAAGRFALLNYEIARELADAPERPRWNPGETFGRASSSP